MEIGVWKRCLTDRVPLTKRSQLFGDTNAISHPRAPPANRRRRRRLFDGAIGGGGGGGGDANASLALGWDGERRRLRGRRGFAGDAGAAAEASAAELTGANAAAAAAAGAEAARANGTGAAFPGLLGADPARLALCKNREDLNRAAEINKCYTGRVVLSVYAAFLADWLASFGGRQLLVLPLEGLDKTPRAWLGGIYAFLGLRPPREDEWADIAPGTTPLSDLDSRVDVELKIVRKTAPVLQCGRDMPLVRFGPMHPTTRLMLQRFFTPWNDELRLLLRARGVATVPGYGLSPDADPIRPPPGQSRAAPRPQRRERELAALADRHRNRRGLWWWDYKEMDGLGAAAVAATVGAAPMAAHAPTSAEAPLPPPDYPPGTPPLPPPLPPPTNSRRKKASHLLSGFGTGLVATPQTRVVRRDSVIDASGASSKRSEGKLPLVIFRQGAGKSYGTLVE